MGVGVGVALLFEEAEHPRANLPKAGVVRIRFIFCVFFFWSVRGFFVLIWTSFSGGFETKREDVPFSNQWVQGSGSLRVIGFREVEERKESGVWEGRL